MEEVMPDFSNSCGKIYVDNVVFAFSNSEKTIANEKIKKVRFREKLTPGSLALVVLPLLAYAVADLVKNFNGLFRIAGYGATLGIGALAFYYAEREYSIVLVMKKGSKMVISVSKGNKKDAKKFVDKLRQNLGS